MFKINICGGLPLSHSYAIVFAFHFNFIYVSETYNFVKLYYDLWSITRDHGLFSVTSQFKLYKWLSIENLISIDYLLMTFLQKFKRKNQYKTTWNNFFTQKQLLSNNRKSIIMKVFKNYRVQNKFRIWSSILIILMLVIRLVGGSVGKC